MPVLDGLRAATDGTRTVLGGFLCKIDWLNSDCSWRWILEGKHPVYVGIDVGSVSANVVVLDEHHNVLEEHYMRTKGEPLETAIAGLEEVVSRYGKDSIRIISATGTGGKLIAPYIGAVFTNEVIAQAKATAVYTPRCAPL